MMSSFLEMETYQRSLVIIPIIESSLLFSVLSVDGFSRASVATPAIRSKGNTSSAQLSWNTSLHLSCAVLCWCLSWIESQKSNCPKLSHPSFTLSN
jgi:hypothetical protein